MNLQQFITNNTGKKIGTGQCGELVDLYLVDVFNNHTSYATAYDYWTNGIPGFMIVNGDPIAGDIACYEPHGPQLPDGTLAYPDGHIAVYAGNGEVFEQNADPDDSPAHLFARADTYLLGYLRGGEDMPNEGDVINAYQIVGETATAADIATYTSKDWSAGDGLYYGKTLVDLKNLQAQLAAAQKTATVLAPGNYKVQ